VSPATPQHRYTLTCEDCKRTRWSSKKPGTPGAATRCWSCHNARSSYMISVLMDRPHLPRAQREDDELVFEDEAR
jgi:hypothetical protein